jgi:hypothetical protein
MKYDSDYILVLDLFVRLVASMKGILLNQETAWLGTTQHLAAKLQMHLGSLFYLTRCTRLPRLANLEISYIDYPSIFVRPRASYETYLVFNFIFIASPTIEEGRFRHRVWELGALLDRQKFSVTERENIDKLQAERKILDLRCKEVTSDVFYASLDSDSQKEARSGN